MFHERHQIIATGTESYRGEEMHWQAKCGECGNWYRVIFDDDGLVRVGS